MNKPRRQTKTIFVFVFFQKASSSCPYAAYQPPSVDNEPLYPASRNPECVSIDTTSSTVHFDNTRDQLVTRPTVDLGYDAAGYSTIQSQERQFNLLKWCTFVYEERYLEHYYLLLDTSSYILPSNRLRCFVLRVSTLERILWTI